MQSPLAVQRMTLLPWLEALECSQLFAKLASEGCNTVEDLLELEQTELEQLALEANLTPRRSQNLTRAYHELIESAAKPVADVADVSACAPETVEQGSEFLLEIWAHIAPLISFATGSSVVATRPATIELRDGDRVTVQLVLPSRTFAAELATDTFVYRGKDTCVQFVVQCLLRAPVGQCLCQAKLSVNREAVGTLCFPLTVVEGIPISLGYVASQPAPVILKTDLEHFKAEILHEVRHGFEHQSAERAAATERMVTELRQVQGGLADIARDQQRLGVSLESVQDLLRQQTAQLHSISQRTDAIFRALKTVAEGTSRVPRLVTLTALESPSWNGAWYENSLSNLVKKAQASTGVKKFYRMQFLCEKTLQPVATHPGYQLELTSARLQHFLRQAGPILGATCSLLKLVSAVGEPLCKIAGWTAGPEALSSVMHEWQDLRDLPCGETTVGQLLQCKHPTMASEDTVDDAPMAAVCHFANRAIQDAEALAQWAGVPLEMADNTDSSDETVRAAASASMAERARCSAEQIQEWVEQACKIPQSLPTRSRLEQQLFVRDSVWDPKPGDVVGGLRLTVMGDGTMLWLCEEAVAELDASASSVHDGGELVETLSSVERDIASLRRELGSTAQAIAPLSRVARD